jgi:alpha-mannosidase
VLPHREYARERIAQAAERLRARVYSQRAAVEDLELGGPCGRVTHQEARLLPYRPARAGEPLGPLFATHWLRGIATVPAEWAGSRVDVLLDTGGEATLWLDGEPAAGLNSGPRLVLA